MQSGNGPTRHPPRKALKGGMSVLTHPTGKLRHPQRDGHKVQHKEWIRIRFQLSKVREREGVLCRGKRERNTKWNKWRGMV